MGAGIPRQRAVWNTLQRSSTKCRGASGKLGSPQLLVDAPHALDKRVAIKGPSLPWIAFIPTQGSASREISIVRQQFSPDVPQFPTIETRSFPYVLDDMPIEFVFCTNRFIFPVIIALRFTSLLIFGQG